MKHLKVSNMTSNAGNTIANQFEIRTSKGTYFQSYESVIAFVPKDRTKKTQLDVNTWDYSVTTGKYRDMFLNENKAETQEKIDSKEYVLKDLNK